MHTGGLQYVKNKNPADYEKFKQKFDNSIQYAKKYFNQYKTIKAMIWSPIVKNQNEKANYNTLTELKRLKENLEKENNVSVELVINERYLEAINSLKKIAGKITFAFTSNVMRLFQIDEYLQKHINKIEKKK